MKYNLFLKSLISFDKSDANPEGDYLIDQEAAQVALQSQDEYLKIHPPVIRNSMWEVFKDVSSQDKDAAVALYFSCKKNEKISHTNK